MPRTVVDSDSEDEGDMGASSSSATAAHGEHDVPEPMDIDAASRSGTKRKQPIEDEEEEEEEEEQTEKGGRDDDGKARVPLMQASLDDAFTTAKVPEFTPYSASRPVRGCVRTTGERCGGLAARCSGVSVG